MAVAIAPIQPELYVGLRVRALREGMDLSLRELAARSGVSAPMLSQVERGETSPTLAVATRIASGLELSLSQLLRLDEGEGVSVVRATERRKGGSRRSGHRYQVLTPPLPGQRAELSEHHLDPGASTGGPDDPPMHEPGARETAVITAGRVRLVCDGVPHDLREGDAVTFDADLPHHFENPSDGEAKMLAVVSAGLEEKLMPDNLFDKIWQRHEVAEGLIYIDLHLVHEVTSPQAFEALRIAGRKVRRPDRTLATADHNVPTDGSTMPAHIEDQLSRVQVETLEDNCEEFGIPVHSIGHEHQGIVHVIGPELGVTQPGMTIVCGDSHTSTHGAFGALAFGIGTSEVEHVLATQTLQQRKPKSMRIRYEGELGHGVTAKDLMLATIGRIGVEGGAGYAIEYAGAPIEALSMEGRMTMCNMTIEAGGRAGMVAPDEVTFQWVEGRAAAPDPLPLEEWRALRTDEGAGFDTEVEIDASELSPQVTWGTTPGMVVQVTDSVPEPRTEGDHRALEYMALEAGTPIQEIELDRVFIGSCTNSRIGDLREAAEIVKGRKVAGRVDAMVVPGSNQVKQQAESEGLDEVFRAAGFDWRSAGCSMCLGMNPDTLSPGERCASTSNRNFEGRQGRGGRTHLVSPKMAAAAAIEGRFVDIREWA